MYHKRQAVSSQQLVKNGASKVAAYWALEVRPLHGQGRDYGCAHRAHVSCPKQLPPRDDRHFDERIRITRLLHLCPGS
eukprot:5053328-Ditylum_brightwellii.AAC.1